MAADCRNRYRDPQITERGGTAAGKRIVADGFQRFRQNEGFCRVRFSAVAQIFQTDTVPERAFPDRPDPRRHIHDLKQFGIAEQLRTDLIDIKRLFRILVLEHDCADLLPDAFRHIGTRKHVAGADDREHAVIREEAGDIRTERVIAGTLRHLIFCGQLVGVVKDRLRLYRCGLRGCRQRRTGSEHAGSAGDFRAAVVFHRKIKGMAALDNGIRDTEVAGRFLFAVDINCIDIFPVLRARHCIQHQLTGRRNRQRERLPVD